MKNHHLNPAKNIFGFIVLYLLFTGTISAQDCKVLKESISESYSGDCKKGKAHGEGTAKGVDSYTGKFKKGLPNGIGKYTWENGNIYEGNFKNGLMEGEGKMTLSLKNLGDSLIVGFWKNGEYIGKYKDLYKEYSRSPNVLSIRVTEVKDAREKDKNAIFISILEKGKVVYSPEIRIEVVAGNYSLIIPSGNSKKVEVINFPFRFNLYYKNQSIELEVYRASTYNISIDFNQ